MKIDLGAKKVAVNRISRVIETGPYTAKVKIIFGKAIKVLCWSSEFVEEPTYGSTDISQKHSKVSIYQQSLNTRF